MIKQPQYIGLEEARQLLAQMGVQLTLRQMQRAAEQDALGRRKLPFFIDPIERKLKIEKNDLISIYFKRQVDAQRNLRPESAETRAKLAFWSIYIALFRPWQTSEKETAVRELLIRSVIRARRRNPGTPTRRF